MADGTEDAVRQRDLLLECCKRCWKKHVAGDESIGWDELSENLRETLCEVMGDEAFVSMVEEIGEES